MATKKQQTHESSRRLSAKARAAARKVSSRAGGKGSIPSAVLPAAKGRKPALGRGAKVTVLFGAREQRGTVLEVHDRRVRVGIDVEGVDEPIVSTYPENEVHLVGGRAS